MSDQPKAVKRVSVKAVEHAIATPIVFDGAADTMTAADLRRIVAAIMYSLSTLPTEVVTDGLWGTDV